MSAADAPGFRLRQLDASVRLGLTLLLLVLAGGFLAAGLHLAEHHEDRDERAGLSLDDLRGAYSGLASPAPLATALEQGHPAELEHAERLPDPERALLLGWLAGERIGEDFDNLDLGDAAPAEVLAARCLGCHARGADDPVGQTLPLEYWDDVKRVAYAREIAATDGAILLASTHTHALALASTTLVLAALMLLTRWPVRLRNALVCLAGVGLALDLAGWWLARGTPAFVYAVVIGGGLYALAMGAMLLAVIVDLWRPAARG